MFTNLQSSQKGALLLQHPSIIFYCWAYYSLLVTIIISLDAKYPSDQTFREIPSFAIRQLSKHLSFMTQNLLAEMSQIWLCIQNIILMYNENFLRSSRFFLYHQPCPFTEGPGGKWHLWFILTRTMTSGKHFSCLNFQFLLGGIPTHLCRESTFWISWYVSVDQLCNSFFSGSSGQATPGLLNVQVYSNSFMSPFSACHMELGIH